MNLQELREFAEEAAIAAGREIMAVYESEDFEQEQKGDKSPLTLADRNAHQVIQIQLEKTGIPILSEEGSQIEYDLRKDWPRFWMVDPLDGTKEFINKNGEFTVNIALIEGGKSIMGIIYVPVTGRLYSGLSGDGAYRKEGEVITQLIPKSTPSDLEELKKQKGLHVVASKSHLDENTTAFIDSLDGAETVSMGSSLKFMAIAEGEAQVYPRFAPTMEWDTAAAQGILESLGYEVYAYPDLQVMQYNKENLLNPYFIAF